jgi:PAS domain S-box-containing protein
MRTERQAAEHVGDPGARCALLMEIFRATPQPLAIFMPPDGRRWLRNRRAEELDSTPEHGRDGLLYDEIAIRHFDGTAYAKADYPIGRALRGETVMGEEFLLRTAAGERHFAANAVPVTGDDGSVVAVVCTWDDVTDSRIAERLFDKIAETTPDVIFLFDLVEGREIYHNARLTPILGYTDEEFNQGNLIDHLVHPDDRAVLRENLARFSDIGDGEVVEYEYRARHKNGSWLCFHARAIVFERDERGKPRVILGLTQDVTARKLSEQALRAAQLAQAEEETRRSIARELHDEMGQHVTALKIGLESIESSGRVNQLLALVQQLDQRIDLLARHLRPPDLGEGLPAALASSFEDFTARYGIPVDFHGGPAGPALSKAVEAVLYRVVQEALTNIAKHARARTVSVIMETREGQFQLIIEDDGSGFDPAEVAGRGGGLGLLGMRERVVLIGGTLHIESNLGAGTSIFVRLSP